MKSFYFLIVSIILILLLGCSESLLISKDDHVKIRLYNMDDYSECYINDQLVYRTSIKEDAGFQDITPYLTNTSNTINIQVYNTACCLTSYGIMIERNGSIIYQSQYNSKLGDKAPTGRILNRNIVLYYE